MSTTPRLGLLAPVVEARGRGVSSDDLVLGAVGLRGSLGSDGRRLGRGVEPVEALGRVGAGAGNGRGGGGLEAVGEVLLVAVEHGLGARGRATVEM